MHIRFFVSLMLLFTSSMGAIVNRIQEDCILEKDGQQVCKPSTVARSLVRGTSSSVTARPATPCGRKDTVCWCRKSLDYTNQVRSKKGLKMLKLGTKMQMGNAMNYASKLSSMGYLVHQNLYAVTKKIGCKRWVGGENLAFNYERGDIARKCVSQWINSKGHYANLVRPWFEEMVVGFHFDKDGRVYCVQTFSLYYPRQTFGRKNAPKCDPVS